ncbi:MAG: helix-turn-helix transcriptional regulator [Eubacteriales bacterium]
MYESLLKERIASLRTIMGVSARDMSLSIGQNENYINHIENGKSMPSMQVFFYICEYLQITPEEFFAHDTENPMAVNEILPMLNSLNNDDLLLVKSFIERMATYYK